MAASPGGRRQGAISSLSVELFMPSCALAVQMVAVNYLSLGILKNASCPVKCQTEMLTVFVTLLLLESDWGASCLNGAEKLRTLPDLLLPLVRSLLEVFATHRSFLRDAQSSNH